MLLQQTRLVNPFCPDTQGVLHRWYMHQFEQPLRHRFEGNPW